MKGTMVFFLLSQRSLAVPRSISVSISSVCGGWRRVVPTAFAPPLSFQTGNSCWAITPTGTNRMRKRELSGAAAAARRVQYGDRVCILAPSSDEFKEEVKDLSARLSLPIHTQDEIDIIDYQEAQGESSPVFTHCVCLEPYQIMDIESYAVAIQSLSSPTDGNASARRKVKLSKKTGKQRNLAKPFFVDFCPQSSTKMGKRLAGGGQKGGELLIKATSLGKNKDSTVCDLTAGLASDSCIMASGGAASVFLVEKDPIVAVLLKDAFRRMEMIAKSDLDGVNSDNELISRAKDLSNKLSFEENDALLVAQRFAQLKDNIDDDSGADRPDICYLDPMFPPRTKSALVKKNMNILHGLLETQSEEDADQRLRQEAELLKAALGAARQKVVVKRPVQALPLGGDFVDKKPSNVINGSINRWDIYVV